MADAPEFLDAVASDGRRVLEADLGDKEVGEWIERARRAGAELLWLHTNEDLGLQGFEPFPRVRPDADGEPAGR